MNFLFLILSKCYLLFLSLWNVLIKCGLLHTYKFKVPVVSVGNITVGGAGKTPVVLLLSKLLQKNSLSHVIVNRGYKKSQRGIVVVNTPTKLCDVSPSLCGDEPFMLAKKLPGIPIVVGENKQKTISFAINTFKPALILLDDGYQSKRIKKDLDILLINSICKKQDFRLMPLGLLREPLKAISRAHFIIFTKNNLAIQMKQKYDIMSALVPVMQKNSIPYCVSNTTIQIKQYDFLQKKLREYEPSSNALSVLCLCGIADPRSFISLAKEAFTITKTTCLADHYNYNKHFDWFFSFLQKAHKEKIGGVVTTYKDFVKIQSLNSAFQRWLLNSNLRLFVLDIDFVLESKEMELLNKIKKLVV